MEREIDFQREYEKIEIIILNECDTRSKTINDEISIAFRKWEHRQNYLSFDELRNELGFTYEKSIKHHGLYFPTGTVKEIDTFLLYCEMIENFFNFVMPRTNNVQRIAHIEKTIFYDLDRIN